MPSSGAFVCSDFVILRVLRRETFVTTKNYKLNESIRFPPFGTTLNSDFERGFEAHHGVGASISMFCASLHLISPCYGELSSCYGEIISLFRGCRQFLSNLLLSIGFSRKNRSGGRLFSLFSACYQGLSGRISCAKAPLRPGFILPSSLPQQARMEPRGFKIRRRLGRRRLLSEVRPSYETGGKREDCPCREGSCGGCMSPCSPRRRRPAWPRPRMRKFPATRSRSAS